MQPRIPEPLLLNYLTLLLIAAAVTPALATNRHYRNDSLDARPAFLQTTRIAGRITDGASRPVANAAVLIAGSERGTISNLSGSFEIPDAPLSGMLVIKHPDFETRQQPILQSVIEYAIVLKPMPRTALRSQAKASKKESEAATESSSPLRLDRWPYFQGGYKALNKFLANNLKYPRQARENGVEGPVQVSFLLDEDGNVSSGRIVKSPGTELDEEALRLVGMMPKWTPAQKDGKPIAVWYTISIHFDPQVDNLPLKIKEEIPKLFSRKMKMDPVKTPLPVKAEFKRLFNSGAVDLSAHEPPQTRLRNYGGGYATRPFYVPFKFQP